MKKCLDCYEENPDTRTHCSRCGRVLEEAGYGKTIQNSASAHPSRQTDGKFEVQHEDAPNVMRRDRSVYRR